jgi:hypothetical protein
MDLLLQIYINNNTTNKSPDVYIRAEIIDYSDSPRALTAPC